MWILCINTIFQVKIFNRKYTRKLWSETILQESQKLRYDNFVCVCEGKIDSKFIGKISPTMTLILVKIHNDVRSKSPYWEAGLLERRDWPFKSPKKDADISWNVRDRRSFWCLEVNTHFMVHMHCLAFFPPRTGLVVAYRSVRSMYIYRAYISVLSHTCYQVIIISNAYDTSLVADFSRLLELNKTSICMASHNSRIPYNSWNKKKKTN